jgi:hypothetical protein
MAIARRACHRCATSRMRQVAFLSTTRWPFGGVQYSQKQTRWRGHRSKITAARFDAGNVIMWAALPCASDDVTISYYLFFPFQLLCLTFHDLLLMDQSRTNPKLHWIILPPRSWGKAVANGRLGLHSCKDLRTCNVHHHRSMLLFRGEKCSGLCVLPGT